MWHGITYSLSSQQDQSKSKDSEKGYHELDLAWNNSLSIKSTGREWQWGQWEGKQLDSTCNHSLSVKPIESEWQWGQWESTQLNLAWNYSLAVNPTWTRVAARTVRRHIAGSYMKITHFLLSQQDKSGSQHSSEKAHSWTWCWITHKLSSQQNQSGSNDSKTWRDIVGPVMESLTLC